MASNTVLRIGTPDRAATIAISQCPETDLCAGRAKDLLEAAGYETRLFLADGTGGRAMEAMIAGNLIAGVLDLTTAELADELVGGVGSAGPNRLTAAALAAIPQVISVGGLDGVKFGTGDAVPVKFAGRRFYRQKDSVTLMRTTPEENDQLGREIALKACAARGPTVIVVPLRGISTIDREGGPFWWPEADQALFQSLRNWLAPNVNLVELDLHIDDPEFAYEACRIFTRIIGSPLFASNGRNPFAQ